MPNTPELTDFGGLAKTLHSRIQGEFSAFGARPSTATTDAARAQIYNRAGQWLHDELHRRPYVMIDDDPA